MTGAANTHAHTQCNRIGLKRGHPLLASVSFDCNATISAHARKASLSSFTPRASEMTRGGFIWTDWFEAD